MRINADFSERAVANTNAMDWVPSPIGGVERKMLDRVGAERARATSLVRYASGSHFPEHEHGGGEEILVLEGVFSDEHGDYPAGSYLRNPVGSRHAPRCADGCVILVKLWQFQPDDAAQIVIDTRSREWCASSREGMLMMPLHRFGAERVSLLRFEPGARIAEHEHDDGEELFVLEGELCDQAGRYPAGTWLRQPPGSRHNVTSESGCITWSKAGHLIHAAATWSGRARP